MVFQEGYLIAYTLKVTIYCQKHDNILISREKKHLIFEKLEGYPNLALADFLPTWAFLDFFAKYLPLDGAFCCGLGKDPFIDKVVLTAKKRNMTKPYYCRWKVRDREKFLAVLVTLIRPENNAYQPIPRLPRRKARGSKKGRS